jgi:hypothetical protein
MAKIHPAKPVSHANGPTSTINSPAKFQNGTKAKMKPAKPVVEAKGPVFTENSTHIPTMNADKAPKESKSMGEKSWFDPHSVKHAGNSDFGGSVMVKNPKVK